MTKISIKRKKTIYYRLLISTSIAIFLAIQSLISNTKILGTSNSLVIFFLFTLTILCLAFFINSIVQILKKSPALIITENELIDSVSTSNIGAIKWENITYCNIKKFKGSPHLVIGLKNYSEILSKLNGFKKKMTEVKIKQLGTPIALNTKLIDFDENELTKLIQQHISTSQLSLSKK
ncbi:MAG: hypothetical protein HYU68_14405 [Bacteroidetes bacterium]|nr:hypothetical protein [Bacteroidota bacterium]